MAAHLNCLVGAFITSDGRIVGRPFPVGQATSRRVPEGAVALSFGINDDNFADNSGKLTATVTLPRPQVTVE